MGTNIPDRTEKKSKDRDVGFFNFADTKEI
jgi:hypothetical protein